MNHLLLIGATLFLIAGNQPATVAAADAQKILDARIDLEKTLSKKRHVCLAWSKNDHRDGIHTYGAFANKWKAIFEKVDGISASSVMGFPDEEQWERSDLVVFFLTQQTVSDKQYAVMDKYLQRGGSVMVIHQALVQRERIEEWGQRIGISYIWEQSRKSKWGLHKQPITLDTENEIFAGFPATVTYLDELYWEMHLGSRGKLTVLGHTKAPKQAADDKTEHPVFWILEHGDQREQGRVFGSVIGHFDLIFDEPVFRTILLRGAAWCMREPFEPFKPLVFTK